MAAQCDLLTWNRRVYPASSSNIPPFEIFDPFSGDFQAIMKEYRLFLFSGTLFALGGNKIHV